MKENNKIGIIPVISYSNAGLDKYKIYKDNRKSGIYCWNNLINGSCYVGSSTKLNRRISSYFSPPFLRKELINNNSVISSALLKYGYSNFSLDILEYCEPNALLSREQYYMDKIKPSYNILKVAGSSLGHKHSAETLLKLKDRKLSPQALINLRAALKKRKGMLFHYSDLWLATRLSMKGDTTCLIDKRDNSSKTYKSVREAAKSIGTSHVALLYCYKNNKLFKNTYSIHICKKNHA